MTSTSGVGRSAEGAAKRATAPLHKQDRRGHTKQKHDHTTHPDGRKEEGRRQGRKTNAQAILISAWGENPHHHHHHRELGTSQARKRHALPTLDGLDARMPMKTPHSEDGTLPRGNALQLSSLVTGVPRPAKPKPPTHDIMSSSAAGHTETAMRAGGLPDRRPSLSLSFTGAWDGPLLGAHFRGSGREKDLRSSAQTERRSLLA
jgi:hypothetical protein